LTQAPSVREIPCVTRARQLPAILNVRLDDDLAGELARIARSSARTQSDVARTLLGYGIDVWRQLESEELAAPFRGAVPEAPETQ
jgi:hypothetical protein